jgi:hypothetical protein
MPIIIINGVGLSPLGTAATSGLLYKPQMINEGDCGAIGGMKIGRGNRSTQRKPAPAPLRPPQIPHDQTQARTSYANTLLWKLVNILSGSSYFIYKINKTNLKHYCLG